VAEFILKGAATPSVFLTIMFIFLTYSVTIPSVLGITSFRVKKIGASDGEVYGRTSEVRQGDGTDDRSVPSAKSASPQIN
jgi:hypothetical protein